MSKQSLNLKKELKCTGFCFLASSDLGTGKDTSVSLRLPERSDALSWDTPPPVWTWGRAGFLAVSHERLTHLWCVSLLCHRQLPLPRCLFVLCLLATGAVVPAVPCWETVGPGPDLVLCAPCDKLSQCQTCRNQSAAPGLTLAVLEDFSQSNPAPITGHYFWVPAISLLIFIPSVLYFVFCKTKIWNLDILQSI